MVGMRCPQKYSCCRFNIPSYPRPSPSAIAPSLAVNKTLSIALLSWLDDQSFSSVPISHIATFPSATITGLRQLISETREFINPDPRTSDPPLSCRDTAVSSLDKNTVIEGKQQTTIESPWGSRVTWMGPNFHSLSFWQMRLFK